MFGLGMGELLVILVIALLFFLGPKKLPDLASTLGKAIRQFRKATSELTDQLQVDDEVKRPLQELKAALRDEPEPHFVATQRPVSTLNAGADKPAAAAVVEKPAAAVVEKPAAVVEKPAVIAKAAVESPKKA